LSSIIFKQKMFKITKIDQASKCWLSGKRYDEVMALALAGLEQTYRSPYGTSFYDVRFHPTLGAIKPTFENDPDLK